MSDDIYEWDEDKAARNRLDHGISFETARLVFKDVFAVEWTDMGQDAAEARFATLGMVDNRLLFVAYTMRGDAIRIISARLAEPYERRRYHNDNET